MAAHLDLGRLSIQELASLKSGSDASSSGSDTVAPSAAEHNMHRPDAPHSHKAPTRGIFVLHRDWLSSFTYAAELGDFANPPCGTVTLHILDRDLIPAKEFRQAITSVPSLTCLLELLDLNGQVLPADPLSLDDRLSGKELDDGPIVFLEALTVPRERRGQGVGSWMLDQVWDLQCMEEATIQNELEKARSSAHLASSPDEADFICTRIPNEADPKLRRFFEKNGFKQIRRTTIWGLPRPEHKRHDDGLRTNVG